MRQRLCYKMEDSPTLFEIPHTLSCQNSCRNPFSFVHCAYSTGNSTGNSKVIRVMYGECKEVLFAV
jgi:hypothetical protein